MSQIHTVSCTSCDTEFQIELEWEPGDSNYGADADGNRGISVPGYFYVDVCPSHCPGCGEEITSRDEEAWADSFARNRDDEESAAYDRWCDEQYESFRDNFYYRD